MNNLKSRIRVYLCMEQIIHTLIFFKLQNYQSCIIISYCKVNNVMTVKRNYTEIIRLDSIQPISYTLITYILNKIKLKSKQNNLKLFLHEHFISCINQMSFNMSNERINKVILIK